MTDHHHTAPGDGSPDEAERLAIPGGPGPLLVWTPVHPGGGLSRQLARIVLDAYTATGDVVLDVDDDVALAAVAARTGRRHHALAGAHHLASLGHAAGYIDLIHLRWPRPEQHPLWLLRACRALLHTSGSLVVAVAPDPGRRLDTLHAINEAARTVDLHLIDHIAAQIPDRDRPATSAERSRTRGRGRVVVDDETATHPAPVHTDLLIFAAEVANDD